MAASYLFVHGDVKADAIYVDIEPDITLDNGGESTVLDLNDDGILDFGFMNTDFTSYDYPYGDVHFQRIMINPFPGNKVAGTYSSTLYSFRYYYPFALNEGVPINESLEFHGYFYQGLATRLFFFTFSGIDTDPAGNWYPEMLDHYLGINFNDAFGFGHYGWIRCDIKDEGRTLVIKDYAFENRVNAEIITGDTIGDTSFHKIPEIQIDSLNPILSSTNNTLNGSSIYSFNKNIYINLFAPDTNYKINIYNIQGHTILSEKITAGSHQYSLNNVTSGIYVVVISDDNNAFSKQVRI